MKTTRMTVRADFYCASQMICKDGQKELSSICPEGFNEVNPVCSRSECNMFRVHKHVAAYAEKKKKVIHR